MNDLAVKGPASPSGLHPKQSQRQLCTRCLHPVSTCFCAELRPVSLNFQLVVLQHPRERKRTIGTGRMVTLSIQNSLLIEGKGFDDHPRVQELMNSSTHTCTVLYPGPNSLRLEPGVSTLLDWVPTGKKLTLFVIDGTWASAQQMMQASPRLLSLPQMSFQSEHRSEYGFRKQPHPHCLSTVEAVHQLSRILDPSTNTETMLKIFRTMVQRQLSYTADIRNSN